MSHYLHSKALFITSLACFSLLQQSEVLADYPVYHCATGTTNCNSCSTENTQYTSSFGQNIACSSTGGCSSCGSICTGMFFDDTNDNDNIYLRLDVDTTGTYVSFSGGEVRVIQFYTDATNTIEIGSQFKNTRSNENWTEFNSDKGEGKTIYLSNSNNDFTTTTSNPTLFLTRGVILQIKADSIKGVDQIEFRENGTLSVPNGGTVSCECRLSDNNAYLRGGTSEASPLVMTGAWTGISANAQDKSPGVLYLESGYIKPGAGAFGAQSGTDGNIILLTGCTLMIDNPNALGNGTNCLSSGGGIVKFLGDVSLPNVIGFNGISGSSLTMDMQGHSAGVDSLFLNYNTLIVNDTSETPGILTVAYPSMGSLAGPPIKITRGTLVFGVTSMTNPIILESNGVLKANTTTYSGTFVVNGGGVLLAGAPVINGAMSGSGTLNITGSGGSSLGIINAAGYTGLLSCDENIESIDIDVTAGSFSGKLDIGPACEVRYIQSVTSSFIYGPIKSIGTYEPGTSPINGATLTIENTTTGAVTSTLTGGNITGNLQIFVKNTSGESNTINADGYSITGCVQLNTNCTINLDKSASILTLVTNQEGTGTSQINGNITGVGSVVVNGNTNFGSSFGSYPTNSFSLLTLTSGVLTAWNPTTLGGSTATLIGNGGTLTNKVTATLANPWIFRGGTTTTFQDQVLTITGSITTEVGSGSAATIYSNGDLILNPSSINIITGTSLLTNGTSVTTQSILGGGGLVLGGGTRSEPIDDALTVTGASSYSGIISNGTNGNGIVHIQAPVTLLGNNTFSGGLHLDPAGTLTINTAGNLGAGTIYFNSGGLTLPLVSSGEVVTVTAGNFLTFTGGSTTLFDVYGSSSGIMELELTGASTITGSTKTANLTVTGGGLLTIGTTFESGSTYNVSAEKGVLVVNSETTTLAYTIPFLDDGVLKGSQDSWFSLADASYANWNVTPVSSSPPAIVNAIVEDGGVLAGNGDVTTAVINAGGNIVPGYYKTGAFTVTDSLVFNTGSVFAVKTDGTLASLLTVGGNTTVNTEVGVFVFPEPGIYTNSNFVILAAGNLEGEFTQPFTPESFFLHVELNYSVPNEVILSIIPRSIQTGVTGANAISVAKALDKVVDWNRSHVDYAFPSFIPVVSPLLPEVFASLAPLPEEEISDALNQLQPAFFNGFTVIQENNIVKVQDALTLRMDSILQGNSCYSFQEEKECCASSEKRIHTWISGLGDVLAQESNTFAGSPQVGYQGKTYGFATGVDGTFAKFLYAGAMGGYTSSYIKWRGHQGTGNINTGYAGLYLSAIGKMFYGNLSLIGGFSDMSSKRHIEYTGVDLTASGNHSGKQLLSHADTGINFSFGGFTIKPFDAFEYVSQTENSYVEKGAGQWGLSLKKSNAILLRNELGLEVSTCLCFKNMKWVVAPKASWVREVRVKGQSYTASFTEAAPADAPFTVTGYFPDRSLFSPGVSLTGSMCQDKVSVELNYQGEFTRGYSDHSYGSEVRYSF